MLIEPGKYLIMNKPGQSEQNLEILQSIKKLVEGAVPWSNTMIIRNQTKTCIVDTQWTNGMITVNVTNPEDETFKLEPVNECPHPGVFRGETCTKCNQYVK